MFEYENERSRSYYITGEVKKDYERTAIRSDPHSLAILCGAGVRVAGTIARVLLSMVSQRNPYRLPR